MNTVYNEDCLITLERKLAYDYVFCVPPDLAELGMDPREALKTYYTWLASIISKFNPSSQIVTIAITDRKYKSRILPKHAEIIEMMREFNYEYISQKLWSRTSKRNLYRLTYTFVMTFARNKKVKQAHKTDFEHDIWIDVPDNFKNFPFGIATAVVRRCIENFTQAGDIVYDPFMGSGTTAEASIQSGRRYIGSEINKAYYDLTQERLAEASVNTGKTDLCDNNGLRANI